MLLADRDRKLLRAIHRYQQHRHSRSPLAWLMCQWGKLGHAWWSILSASDISREAQIHPSTRMPHPTGIVIHAQAVIGPNCQIMQQVTIGQTDRRSAPVLEEGCYIGAGARVLGPLRIGRGARIGANAVVLNDVPAGATAVGIPARLVRQRD
jgi:serine O-acetyltransferase